MMKYVLLIFIYIICSSNAAAQGTELDSIRIPLESANDSLLFGNVFFQFRKSSSDQSNFIVPKQITNYTVYSLEVNPKQSGFSRMIENKLTHMDSIFYDFDELNKFANKHKKGLKSIVNFIVSSTNNDSVSVITDTNCNLDFTDEVIDVISVQGLTSNLDAVDISKVPRKRITYDYYLADKNEIIKRELNFRIIVHENYASKKGGINFRLTVKSDEGRRGEFNIGDEKLIAYVKPYASLDDFSDFEVKIFNTQDSMPFVYNTSKPFLRDGNFIRLENQDYHIVSSTVFGDELYLKKIKPNEIIYGDMPKQYMKKLEAETIYNKPFKRSQSEDKYVLLDFWGMWCQPCIRALPDVKKIKEAYKDLEIVSIALLIREEKIEDLRNFVEKNDLDWTHIGDTTKSLKESIITQLRVGAYPSYILVDPKGMIVFRSLENSNSIAKLNKLLHEIYGKDE